MPRAIALSAPTGILLASIFALAPSNVQGQAAAVAATTPVTAAAPTEPEGRGCSGERPVAKPGENLVACVARVQVFLAGNVKDVLGGASAPGVLTGALGMHYIGNTFEVTGNINVVGPADTVKTQLGSSLLLPSVGSALNAASATIRGRFQSWNSQGCAKQDNLFKCNFGYRIHADASTRKWATQTVKEAPAAGLKDSTIKVIRASDVPMWGVDAGISYTFFSGEPEDSDKKRRPVAMILDAGLVHRAIRGDIGSQSPERKAQRDSLLHTMKRNFSGYQVGMTMQFDQIRSSFYYVRLNGNVDGLSSGQIVAAIDLREAFTVDRLWRR